MSLQYTVCQRSTTTGRRHRHVSRHAHNDVVVTSHGVVMTSHDVVMTSQRRRRGVEQLVARHVRLHRPDGCWGRLTTATTQPDDDDDDDVSDNEQLPRQQLLSAATTTSQSAFTAVATANHDDYGTNLHVYNTLDLVSFTL